MATTRPESPAQEQQPATVIETASTDDSTTPREQQQVESAPKETAGQESQLHAFCAEGDVMGVRGILSSSLEYLESIGVCRWSMSLAQAHAIHKPPSQLTNRNRIS